MVTPQTTMSRPCLRAGVSILFSVFLLGACARPRHTGPSPVTIALLPFTNYTEVLEAPDLIMPLVSDVLEGRGFTVVAGPPVEEVLYRHRIRHTTMVGTVTAQALAQELGVSAVMVGMINLFQESQRPQVGISARLVALPEGIILWADDVALSGEDFTRMLGLGTVRSSNTLSALAVRRLFASLEARLEPQEVTPSKPPGLLGWLAWAKSHKYYRSPNADFYGVDTLAVLPFLNVSSRPDAGEIVTALFVSGLHNTGLYRVVEPGLVRDVFLRYRITTVGAIDRRGRIYLNRHMNVNGYLLGTVYEYNEGGPRLTTTVPTITLSARMVRADNSQVVWSMENRHQGSDFNFVLDFDRIYSIIPLVRLTVDEMVQTFSVTD